MPLFSPLFRRIPLLAGLVAAGLSTPGCRSKTADAALLRLYFADETLLASNDKLLRSNEGQVKQIHALTVKNRNLPADLAVLQQAEAVHDSTRAVVDHLRDLRERLLRRTDNLRRFRNLDAHREVAALLGSDGPGAADTLQRHLRQHARLLARVAPGPARTPVADADFEDATVTAALATFSQLESAALVREGRALAALQARVGGEPLKTTVRPLAAAYASTVAPGETYKAELLLINALTTAKGLQMTANGQPVPVDADGFGRVAFTAPALGGAARRELVWQGTIAVHANGRDSTFRVRVPYTVVRRK
jgi:hypothetical protein